MNLGRHELLQWVNTIVQAEYPTIQSLADGIAYCQIFEAVHPGSINATRMTLTTKLPIDCLKNLRILESALKNMKLSMTVSIQKMANGRFQDNIIFTQWLYAHSQKYGKQNLSKYAAYERRLYILQKQGKSWDQVNIHLLPNQAYMMHQHGQAEDNLQQLDQKLEQIGAYVQCLQNDLKEKMESNWRVMHMINRSIEERNALFSLLEQIQKVAIEAGQSPVQRQILKILYETPENFK